MNRCFRVTARVALERSGENLFAHTDLDAEIGPGDHVRLHGPPIRLAFGECGEVLRPATILRASPLRRAWTRFAGHFLLTELYEVSFSAGRLP